MPEAVGSVTATERPRHTPNEIVVAVNICYDDFFPNIHICVHEDNLFCN